MRWKPVLFASAFALVAVSARAQVLTQTTIVTSRPGVVLGAPVVAAPIYPTTVVSPYSVASPVVVRRRVVVSPTVYGAPAVVAGPIVPAPMVVSPVAPMVVRRGWGPGPGFGFGPRPWGWRGW